MMQNKMTIDEVRQSLKKTESDIALALQRFHDETGCTITDLAYSAVDITTYEDRDTRAKYSAHLEAKI